MRRVSKHISPATILALVALVFAVTGGAYAASNGGSGSPSHVTLTASAAKAKAKAKAKQGPRGLAGARGPAGPQGPAGAAGAKGENGAPGANGTNGTAGANGKSVVLVNEEPEHCANEAGVTYEIEGSGKRNEVCSSSASAHVAELPKTLGPEETETGSWATPLFAFEAFVPISFPIPLEAELDSSHVVIVEEPTVSVPAQCEHGTVHASVNHPEAKPGYLCVFKGNFAIGSETHLESIRKPGDGSLGASTAGAVVELIYEGGSGNHGAGTWAVTAS